MEKEDQNSFDLMKLIPNSMTMGALCLGLFAVRLAIIDNYKGACICILVACLLDALDGRVARKLNVTSEFGAQMDSLADFFNFGIAPGFIVYFWKMDDFNLIKGVAWAPVLILAVCMAVRLARFNVSLNIGDPENPLHKYFFQGIPAPMAAMLVLFPLFVSFEYNIALFNNPIFVILNTTIVALLAGSTIPTPCVKKVKISNAYRYVMLLSIGLIIIFTILKTWLMLMAFSLVYVIGIFISWYYYFKFLNDENNKQINNKK